VEDKAPCKKSELVVCELMDIVERTKDRGCAFKLLLTSPRERRVIYKNLLDQERDVVWMSTKVPLQGGFTGMKWSTSIDLDVALFKPRLDNSVED